ncbi:MAG TPA: outer membrane lipoprotein carrier protein LolA [Chitinophagaceae bacterium]|nr:outer membrane lipoprotein carrier protein LolA [Chitinophagaceae bacterium]
MKRKSLLLLLFSFMSLGFVMQSAFAQSSKAVLDKVSSKLQSSNKLQATVSFTMENKAGKKMTEDTGVFYMQGDAYKIKMKNQEIITNGKTIWTYLIPNKEVQISNYVEAEQSISPKQLFSGSYDKEFSHAYLRSSSYQGKNVHVVKLTPKKNQSFSTLDLYINKANNEIVGGIMHLKNGGKVNYTITNLNLKPNFPAGLFEFNTKANPNVEVIDLR